MNFRRPLATVTPTLDGDVLTVLARGDVEFSGRELARRVARGSAEGVRRAADRLADEGVLSRRAVGGAHLYSLNRRHIAARWIEGLATLPEQLIERMRALVAAWREPAAMVFMFGSAARGEATADSDLDLLVIRRADCDADSESWRAQLLELQLTATAMSGNDTRILEAGEDELGPGPLDAVLQEVVRDGIELLGSKHALKRLTRARARG